MNPLPSLAGHNAVVTGVAGFIGSHLATALIGAGAKVIGIDLRSPHDDQSAAINLATLVNAPNFTYVVADLRTAPLTEHVRDADVVYHLAAIPGVRPSWGSRFEDYTSCNILATQRIMHATTQLRVPRVVVASSSSVYGPTDGSSSKETDPPRPSSPYGVTKLAAEQLCLAHAARTDSATTAVGLRYFSVYGPRQRPDMFIQRALTATLTGEPLHLFGHGHRRRDFTFVDDVVAATIAAGTAHTPNAVLNVGAGVGASLQDVLEIIRQLVDRPTPVATVSDQAGDVNSTLANIAAAQQLLNWQPTVTLTDGIARQLHSLDPTMGIFTADDGTPIAPFTQSATQESRYATRRRQ